MHLAITFAFALILVSVLVKDLVIVMVLAPLSTNAGCSILPASKDALSADMYTF